jgi:hypothetical protein
MIKSKIDARERALELAIEWRKAMPNSVAETTESMAENFAKFLIGDAELPEVFDDNGHLKELFEVAQREMEKMNKRNDDLFGDIIKTLPEDVIRDKGLVGLVPCKSEAE